MNKRVDSLEEKINEIEKVLYLKKIDNILYAMDTGIDCPSTGHPWAFADMKQS